MPIKDLLWACPICHRIESIAGDGRCEACHTRFTRGRGAAIRAKTPDGVEEQHPLDWLAMLPWQDLDGEGRSLPAGLLPPFTQLARVQLALDELPLRRGGEYLGAVERFGRASDGRLELTESLVSFSIRRGNAWSWPLDQITAIQTSSSSIQLKAKSRPVASLRFPRGSMRLWEQRLQFCVRQAYARAGQGDIVEFQPRIRIR